MKSRCPSLYSGLALLLLTGVLTSSLAETVPLTEVQPRLEEKLGQSIDLGLVFYDEQGKKVKLADFFDKPVVLIPVYYRCPGICTPVLYEVASAVNRAGLAPGDDYRLLSVSFDAREKESPALAKNKKQAVYDEVKNGSRQLVLGKEDWIFLTGEWQSILALTNSIGFHFRQEKDDFVHVGTVVVLSPKGKIVRYLDGLEILGMELKLAVIDASVGRPANLIHKIQRLCFSYDPAGKSYLIKINRIILLVSLIPLMFLAGYLMIRPKGKQPMKRKATRAKGKR
jgi:protein SCO1/2